MKTETAPLIFLICVFLSQTLSESNNEKDGTNIKLKIDAGSKNVTKTLSRRKRFLIFPTGSSVSIATCMTVGVYGNPQFSLWSWAVNYGFAYNLPTNSSEVLNPPEDIITFPFYNVDDDTKKVESTSTTEKASEATPIDDSEESHDHENSLISNATSTSNRRKFYVYSQPSRYETQPMMYRRYRRDLYRNIEAVIDKMGYNGRDCVLQALCESPIMLGKKKRRTMVQELIKTVFTLPKSKVLPFEHTELVIYDKAHRDGQNNMDCGRVYSKCNFSLINLMLGKYSKPFFEGFM